MHFFMTSCLQTHLICSFHSWLLERTIVVGFSLNVQAARFLGVNLIVATALAHLYLTLHVLVPLVFHKSMFILSQFEPF